MGKTRTRIHTDASRNDKLAVMQSRNMYFLCIQIHVIAFFNCHERLKFLFSVGKVKQLCVCVGVCVYVLVHGLLV